MSRPLRLEFAGALYHITARGNERKAIYADEADFEVFLEIIDSVYLQHNWVIHARARSRTFLEQAECD
ncbi:hypothetical protein [Aeromonas rivipollensis]|uniref:hypothetical protein n=1 Tax=Aeromonas rivipollensis TaxID=948519 RepID=UPI0038DDC0C4